MRLAFPLLALACGSPDGPGVGSPLSPVDTAPSGDTSEASLSTAGTGDSSVATGETAASPPVLSTTTPVLAVPPGGDQHHATVALRPEGTALVAYDDGPNLLAARVLGSSVQATRFTGDANHGQVRATPDGWVLVGTLNGGVILAGTRLDPLGEPFEPAAFLSVSHARLPDLVTTEVGGLVVSTNLQTIKCLRFEHPLAVPLDFVDCPEMQDTKAAIGTVTAADPPEGPVYAWTELHRDGSLDVFVATTGSSGLLPYHVDNLGWGEGMAGRPMLSVDQGRQLLVWRGAPSKGAPVQSHLQGFLADGTPDTERFTLGAGGETERPALAGPHRDVVFVAWEEGEAIWLQLRDRLSLAPVGEPLRLDDGEEVPQRPSIAVIEGADGLEGVASWELVPPAGAARSVRMRRFRADW